MQADEPSPIYSGTGETHAPAPDDLITDETICAAARAYGLSYDAHTWARMEAALRAVAPMIAARALEIDRRANKELP